MPLHVVLLGDSIFDNARYVPGEPCVHDQLRRELGARGEASLLATDGDVTADVLGQLTHLPAAATHLVVSSGGNDALRHRTLLAKPIANSSELLGELAAVQDEFAATYTAMLRALTAKALPSVVCTVYDSNFPQPEKRLADVALAVFNATILRLAGEFGVPVIDLRRIFTSPADYANPIEPSALGGAKMTAVIARVVAEHDFRRRAATLYP